MNKDKPKRELKKLSKEEIKENQYKSLKRQIKKLKENARNNK